MIKRRKSFKKSSIKKRKSGRVLKKRKSGRVLKKRKSGRVLKKHFGEMSPNISNSNKYLNRLDNPFNFLKKIKKGSNKEEEYSFANYLNSIYNSTIEGMFPKKDEKLKGLAQWLEYFTLQSPLGNNFVNKIKDALNKLDNKQLVLLANNKIDIYQLIKNAIMNTNKNIYKDIKEVKEVKKEEVKS